MEVRCTEGTFVHAEGAQRGSSVPGGGICPQAGAFVWMRRGNSSRLSTYRVPSVEVRCPGSDFRGPEGTPIQIIFCF